MGLGGRSPEGQRPVPYPEARTIFLSELLSEDGSHDEVEWLVQVGAFVRDCWLSEQQHLGEAPLDEVATHHLWDEFSDDDIFNIRLDALLALKAHRRSKYWSDAWEYLASQGADNFARWGLNRLREVGTAVTGALGLLLVWWILATTLPELTNAVTDELRSTADRLETMGRADATGSPTKPSGAAVGKNGAA